MTVPGWTYEDIMKKVFNTTKKKNYELYRSLSGIYTRKNFTHISKDYEFAPLTNKTKHYSDEITHKVCQLIKDGYRNFEIVKRLNVSKTFVRLVRIKKIRTEISDQYF